jgi:hypothetical protein
MIYPNSPSDFLTEIIFKHRLPDEHLVVAVIPAGTDHYFQYAYAPHPEFDECVRSDAWYFCGCTSRAVPDERARITRKNDELGRCYVIVCDDVGTKIDGKHVLRMLPLPSYALETSRGNYQLGWFLEEPVRPEVANAFYRGLAEAGLTDVGAAKAGQMFRLPGSLHRTGWRAELSGRSHLQPVSWDDMTIHVKPIEVKARNFDLGWEDQYQPGDEKLDLIYAELKRRGLVKRLKSDGWCDIICPGWRGHTNGNQLAGYMVGGGFHCFHSCCEGRGLGDLMVWLFGGRR